MWDTGDNIMITDVKGNKKGFTISFSTDMGDKVRLYLVHYQPYGKTTVFRIFNRSGKKQLIPCRDTYFKDKDLFIERMLKAAVLL